MTRSRRPVHPRRLLQLTSAVGTLGRLEMTSREKENSGWEIEITGGLHASFFQPDGSSRPGTDWWVVFRRGSIEHKVLVRTYPPEHERSSTDSETRAVFDHVVGLLNRGWEPTSYTGTPGELSVDLSAAAVRRDSSGQLKVKPWWQFWRQS
jgi:hypothetical protein